MPPKFDPHTVKKTINCKGRLLDLSGGCIMGILNTTPDSFFDGGAHSGIDAQVAQAGKMLDEGAKIIDVGGYSTRPGADDVRVEEERQRVIPLIEELVRAYPDIMISIDTFRAQIAEEAVKAGAVIINDISAGLDDAEMLPGVARLQAPYIMMHKKGTPKNMQQQPQYEDVTREVIYYFTERLAAFRLAGVQDIIIDPGFGFGKTLAHNYELLHKLYLLQELDCPILAGVSRKGMVHRLLGIKPADALNGSTALHTLALLHGCSILRVHDVKEAMETLKIVNYYRGAV